MNKLPPCGAMLLIVASGFLWPNIARADHPGVTAAAIFVRQHFHEPIVVKDVATRAGMSVRSLQAEYPPRVGCTVKDDIQRSRLKRAERLLETTDLKLAAVASESGFKNAEYLCAVFQAKHHVTPQTWRVEHRQG